MTSPPRTERRDYLDWLRGVGVLIMIEAHTLDSWTRVADRSSAAYRWAIVAGGFGAPIFLYLAGVAMALAAGSRKRRGMNDDQVARRAERRACQIVVFAFLFRLQSLVISGGGLRAFLKVDILNVMGVSMLVAAFLWRVGRTPRRRSLVLTIATLLTAMLTPPIRTTPALNWLPDVLEAYVRPAAGRSTFTFFPWAGFLFAGVVAGLWLDASTSISERTRNVWMLVVGVAIGVIGYGCSLLPPIYMESSYWTSSPTFFLVRLGIIIALVPAAFAWSALTFRTGGAAPIREMGVASLFVYWIHVEMVYGIVSTPLHRALSLPQVLAAMTVLAAFLYGLVRLKHWAVKGRTIGEIQTFFARSRARLAPQPPQSR